MAEKENQILEQAKLGFFNDLFQNMNLIFALIKDKRVNFAIKLVPLASLVYLIIPSDLLPLNPIDDALVMWLGFSLFIKLCPDDVVEEHRQILAGKANPEQDEVVEGTYKEL